MDSNQNNNSNPQLNVLNQINNGLDNNQNVDLNGSNNNPFFNNNSVQNNLDSEVDELYINTDRKFISNETQQGANNLEFDNNNLNDNLTDTMGGNGSKYSNDPKVIENLKQKNTISINGEFKVFVIIVLVLLGLIFLFPTIYDLIRKIGY